MVRKHKSEDNIEIEGKKMMDEKWEKPEKEGENKRVVKIKDDVSPYIHPNLEKEI